VKLVAIVLPSPGSDGQAIFTFPKRTRRFRVQSVFLRVQTEAADITVAPLLTVKTGDGALIGEWSMFPLENGPLISNVTFSPNVTDSPLGLPAKASGVQRRNAPIPPDLWLNPQDQMSLQLLNASPGGSGTGTIYVGQIILSVLE
jgi:hypothetical protein